MGVPPPPPGLGGFSCGRVAGRGPRLLCLIAAGLATEICFSYLCCRLDGVGCGDGGHPGCWIAGEVSQSIGSIGFTHISVTFDNLFLLISFMFIVSRALSPLSDHFSEN